MSANRNGKGDGWASLGSRGPYMGIVAESAASRAGRSCAKEESGTEAPFVHRLEQGRIGRLRVRGRANTINRNWRWPLPRTWARFCAQCTKSARSTAGPTERGRRSRPSPASLVRFLFCRVRYGPSSARPGRRHVQFSSLATSPERLRWHARADGSLNPQAGTDVLGCVHVDPHRA